jgi:multisubunit Na+/H+ antiporter MnhB subunit
MNIRFSPLLATGARTMVPTLLLVSVYILIVGHDSPGGGFAGGLIAATALLLLYLAFGVRGLRRLVPVPPETLIGIGLGVALLAGLLGILFHDALLSYTFAAFDVIGIGELKLSSLLLFDVGVYVLVIGLATTGILRLGGDGP